MPGETQMQAIMNYWNQYDIFRFWALYYNSFESMIILDRAKYKWK